MVALGIPPRSEYWGGSIDSARAMSLHSVFRAVAIITTAVKQLPIDAVKNGLVTTPTPSLLLAPNINDSLPHFLEMTTASLALRGNAYWLVDRNDFGAVTNVQVLNPLLVQPVWSQPLLQITSWMFNGVEYAPDQIVQLKLQSQFGSPVGVGPLQQAGADIAGAIDTRDYAAYWFKASGVPGSVYLTTDQPMNSDAAKANRDAWNAAANDRDGIPILTGGLKLASTLLTPEEAQWLAVQNFDVTKVARLFGIPESLFVVGLEGKSSITYSNISDREISFVRFTLAAYFTEIESALSSLLPRGTTAKFNLDSLLRADTDARYAAYAAGISAGWLLPSEVRALEGLPPKAGIDKPKTAPAPEPSALPIGEPSSATAPKEVAA